MNPSDITEQDEKGIFFFQEDVDMPIIDKYTTSWLLDVIDKEKKTLDTVHYYFCSDEFLLGLNIQHLNHNTYTDIISFPYSYEPISGEIFISTERVAENALKYNVAFDLELNRVIVHGLLHLCGYKDESNEEKKLMRSKENHYLKSPLINT
jgi:probable rRNA maturation factor